MKHFWAQRRAEILITLFSFCCCLWCFTFITDDYASFSWSQAAGQFSNYPICEFYWGTLGLGKGFGFLYRHWPEYNWTGMFMVAGPVVCLYLVMRTISQVILKGHRPAMTRVVQLLFALFFSENIVYMGTTRISLLLCGTALLNLLFSDKMGRKGAVINTLIFIMGMLLRPESSMGLLLLVSLGYLVYRFNPWHVITRAFLPAAATALLFITYSVDWAHTDLFLKKVEPEVEYKLMEKRVIGISGMRTAIDSVKYQAAVGGLCFDTRVMTAEYFRSILSPGPDLSLKHARLRLAHILSLYRYYLFIPGAYLALVLLCFFQPGRWMLLFRIVSFQLATFLILYAVDYTGGLIAGRHFLTLQLISLLILTFYFFSATAASGFWYRQASLPYGCLLVAAVTGALLLIAATSCVYVMNYKATTGQIAAATDCYEHTMQGIDDSYHGQLIVFTTDNFHLFDHSFSFKNKVYRNNKYLMFDVWTHYLYPQYLAYLGSECHCDPLDPAAFFSWLSARRALYMAEPWRYDLTGKYMRTVHGQKLDFIPDSGYRKPDCLDQTNMKAFELRRVVVTP